MSSRGGQRLVSGRSELLDYLNVPYVPATDAVAARRRLQAAADIDAKFLKRAENDLKVIRRRGGDDVEADVADASARLEAYKRAAASRPARSRGLLREWLRHDVRTDALPSTGRTRPDAMTFSGIHSRRRVKQRCLNNQQRCPQPKATVGGSQPRPAARNARFVVRPISPKAIDAADRRHPDLRAVTPLSRRGVAPMACEWNAADAPWRCRRSSRRRRTSAGQHNRRSSRETHWSCSATATQERTGRGSRPGRPRTCSTLSLSSVPWRRGRRRRRPRGTPRAPRRCRRRLHRRGRRGRSTRCRTSPGPTCRNRRADLPSCRRSRPEGRLMRRLARRRPRMRRGEVLGHARLAAQRAYRDRGCESDAAEADHDCCDAAGARAPRSPLWPE